MDDARPAAILAYVTRDTRIWQEFYIVHVRLMVGMDEFYKPGRKTNWKNVVMFFMDVLRENIA